MTGDSKEGGSLEQVMYEGYGPHGMAMMIEVVTDNRNRAVAEIRHVLNRFSGSMAEAGSVAWQFKRISYFSFPTEGHDPDAVFELAVEAGADDVSFDDGTVEIIGPAEAFKAVSDRLKSAEIYPDEAELRMIPNIELGLSTEETLQGLKVVEALEDLDDVHAVYHNLQMTDEILAQFEEA